MRAALPTAFLTIPLAHRGYHDHAARRPENAASAFQAAVNAGYGIELDVQLSADGQAMVFHDDGLARMTGKTGTVLQHGAAELAAMRLRDSDDTIPTLPQVLDLVAGRVPVLIEVKSSIDSMVPISGRLELAVAEAMKSYRGPVAVMSYNPNCVAEIARLASGIPRGLTTEYFDPAVYAPIPAATCARLRDITDYDRTGSSFISHCATDLDHPRVAELKSGGAGILCWTIRSPAAEAAARKFADNITFESYPARIPGSPL